MTTVLNSHAPDEQFPMRGGKKKKENGVDVMMKYTDCPLIDWVQGP